MTVEDLCEILGVPVPSKDEPEICPECLLEENEMLKEALLKTLMQFVMLQSEKIGYLEDLLEE